MKTLKNRDSESSGSGPSEEENKEKDINQETNSQDDDEEEEDDDDDIEDSILERLKNQAKILQELGGEIPDEIKELISTSISGNPDSPEKPMDCKGDAPIFDIPESELEEDKVNDTPTDNAGERSEEEDKSQVVLCHGSSSDEESSYHNYRSTNTVLSPVELNLKECKSITDDFSTTESGVQEQLEHCNNVPKDEESITVESDCETNVDSTLEKHQQDPILNVAEVKLATIEPVSQTDILEKPVTLRDDNVHPTDDDSQKELIVADVKETLLVNGKKQETLIVHEKAPTSFSLIAGYGNEDDSDGEEDTVSAKPKESETSGPLFPIVIPEKDKSVSKNLNIKVIKLSAKAKELIHCSTTTERARATDFVSTTEGLKPAEYTINGRLQLSFLFNDVHCTSSGFNSQMTNTVHCT